ncbi:class A beta-lactamase-related serine hydrolase [Paenibacillaceae bacterium]|nr:class A beta-lactamase-related serine hydrolase [Paenibacillaceae bacterium]
MNIVKSLDRIAAKGLYPQKDNVIFVGITDGGERQYRLYGQLPAAVTDHSALFEIGSMTKVFTALLLTHLVQQNMISLDDPVAKFLPAYAKSTTAGSHETTLRHLATHTSGLPREDNVLNKRVAFSKEKRLNPYLYYTSEDLTSFLSTHQLNRKKIGKWNYSNIGMALLARILEHVLQIPYEQAVEELVCAPLGLSDTVFRLNNEQQQRKVEAFTKKRTPIPPLQIGGVRGAGGMSSTMQDMMRFVELNLGIIDSTATDPLHFSHQKQANGPDQHFNMGLGWFIKHSKHTTHPVVWTGGTTIGFHTYAGFIKEKKLGVVVLSSYHLKLFELIQTLMGKGPIVTDRLATTIFENAYKAQPPAIN